MGHLSDGTETELKQLKATIKLQEEMLAQKVNEVTDLGFERDALQAALKTKGNSVERLTPSLDAIYQSHGWKVLLTRYGLRERLSPNNLRRRIANLVRNLRNQMERLWSWRDTRLVAESGLFDRDWYLQQNPDVAAAGLNPLEHYLRRGA